MASMFVPLLFEETHVTIPGEAEKERKLRLFRAAISGQSEIVEQIYKDDPEVFNDKITNRGETALHVAAAAGHTEFVKEIIHKMTPEAIRLRNDRKKKDDRQGNTAFCHAAISGNVQIAEKMLEKDESLVTIPGKNDKLPLHMAAVFGHKEMVKFLYHKTADRMHEGRESKKDGIDLLVALIDSGIYDLAITMVKDHPELATAVNTRGQTALNALAREKFDLQTQPIARKKGNNLCYGKEVQETDTREQDYLELVRLLWKVLLQNNDSEIFDVIRNDSNTSQVGGNDSKISKVIKSYNHPIFTAAAQGNVEFLTTLIGSYPDLLYELDENKHSIFHIAVLHRQEHVFALIKTIGPLKHFLAVHTNNENNMLHLAGELPPQSRLDVVPGAAFQFQRELLWFEEVKKVVPPSYIEAKNEEQQTPLDLFLKRHKKLIDDGKTWMKETSDNCMLVATFIAGVAFAAALSVPGGTVGGVPVLLKQTSFQVFAVADGLSLLFTIATVLTFFSILTSRSNLEDCLWRLPTRLLFGLVTLFISIVALMVAFVAAFFIVLGYGKLGLSVPIAALAPIPVLLFIYQQCKPFADVLRATHLSKSLFQPKHCLLSAWKSNESL